MLRLAYLLRIRDIEAVFVQMRRLTAKYRTELEEAPCPTADKPIEEPTEEPIEKPIEEPNSEYHYNADIFDNSDAQPIPLERIPACWLIVNVDACLNVYDPDNPPPRRPDADDDDPDDLIPSPTPSQADSQADTLACFSQCDTEILTQSVPSQEQPVPSQDSETQLVLSQDRA